MVTKIAISSKPYRGRFAPSPTGPLHFGSLVSAVGSFLQARSHNGSWLLRIEDLDPPRVQIGATDNILRTLEKFGLHWDGEVVYQSARYEIYQSILDQLALDRLIYPCACTRKDIQEASNGLLTTYPEICRHGLNPSRSERSLRLKTEYQTVHFRDLIQGIFQQNLRKQVGDFVLKRADGFYAYQLAVVVDDSNQGINEIVRGCDLLDNTPRQIYLQSLLNYPQPRYVHLPIATKNGEKLSKQTGATAVGVQEPVATLVKVMEFLGQQPPDNLTDADLEGFWQWAISHWDVKKVKQTPAIEI